ncbi:hypothetical protein CFIICLFH_5054 [Methylobacterium goesingense]|nr:hypothetical protein CFIICLFH_5054 [Methylobacterium goesingense]
MRAGPRHHRHHQGCQGEAVALQLQAGGVGFRVVGAIGRRDGLPDTGPGFAGDHQEAPGGQLAMVRHARRDRQDRVEFGCVRARPGEAQRRDRAAGAQEIEGGVHGIPGAGSGGWRLSREKGPEGDAALPPPWSGSKGGHRGAAAARDMARRRRIGNAGGAPRSGLGGAGWRGQGTDRSCWAAPSSSASIPEPPRRRTATPSTTGSGPTSPRPPCRPPRCPIPRCRRCPAQRARRSPSRRCSRAATSPCAPVSPGASTRTARTGRSPPSWPAPRRPSRASPWRRALTWRP